MSSFFPYEGFLEVLRDNGFSVGMDSYMRVQALTRKIDTRLESEKLKYLLCPLFAHNEKEQRKFYRLYDNYFQLVEQHADELAQGLIEEEPAEPEVPIRKKKSFKPNWTQISRWGFALLSILVSLYLVHLLRKTYFTMKGDQNKVGAFEYLQKYELNRDHDYVIHLLRYLKNDLLGQAQVCDSLADLDFSIDNISQHSSGGFEVSFMPDVLDSKSPHVWDFGDSTGQRIETMPTHIFADTGVYVISLSVENAYGCKAYRSKRVPIVLPQTCWAGMSYVASPLDDRLISFTDSSLISEGDELIRWTWSMGDDANTVLQGADIQFQYTAYRPYKVCLNIETAQGCKDQLCKVIRLDDPMQSQSLLPLTAAPFRRVDISKLSSPNTLFFWLFAAIFIFIAGICYELYRLTRRRLIHQRSRANTGPLTWPLYNRPLPHLFGDSLLHRVATHLRQRQESNLLILNMEDTIKDTIESGGYPNFRFELGSRPSEYLVLIDQRSGRDHQARLFQVLMEELSEQDVYVDQFFFRSHPNLLYKEGTDTPIYLHDLKVRYPDHRLLIFGDGEGLIDPVSGEFQPTYFELLDWVDRAILTPLPPADWGFQEISLAREFLILPASSSSLSILLSELEEEKNPNIRRWNQGKSLPSPDWEEENDVSTLQTYLGPSVFRWLAACAVYPELHWDLTLSLGRMLEKDETKTELDLISESNLLTLCRLPYFRSGGIPDSLRLDLVETLDAETLDHVREVILEVLEKNPPPEDSVAAERLERHKVCQEWELAGGSWDQRRRIREKMEEWVERDEIEDVVVLRDLGKKRNMKMPGKGIPNWGRWMFRNGIPLLGMKAWLRVAMVLLVFVMIITPLYQEKISWSNFVEFREWLRHPGNIVQIDKQYYRLADARDSARYFSYLGGEFYALEDYGSAFNQFKAAVALQPFDRLYRYQLGLASYHLTAIQPSEAGWQETYESFALSNALSPALTEKSKFNLQREVKDQNLRVATISDDGNWLALAKGNQVNLLQWASDTIYATWRTEREVDDLRFSPDGRFLLQTEGNIAALYLCRTGERLRVYNDHQLPIQSARFSPDGTYILTGSDDRAAVLWNRDAQLPFHVLEDIHYGSVYDAEFSSTGTYIVTASGDSSAGIWEAVSGRLSTILQGQNEPIRLGSFLPDNHIVLTGSDDGTILLWNMDGTLMDSAFLQAVDLTDMLLNPEGSNLLTIQKRTAEEPLDLHVWDYFRNQLVQKVSLPVWDEQALKTQKNYTYESSSPHSLPYIRMSRTGKQLLITRPGQGYLLYEINHTSFDSLKYDSQYNQSAVAYQQEQFQTAFEGFSRLSEEKRSEVSADIWYARGLTALYLAAEKGGRGDTAMFRLAIQDFTYAIGLDSDYLEAVGKLIPLLHEVYTLDPESYVPYRSTLCDLLTPYQKDACVIFDFDEVRPFYEGRAAVRLGDKWGFIDTLQQVIVLPQFIHVDNYLRGVAFATDESGNLSVIDNEGKSIYAEVRKPSEGLVAVKNIKTGLWGYFEVKSHLQVIASKYQECSPFSLGYAKVRENGKYGFIDKTGDDSVYGGIVYDAIKGEFRLSKVLSATQGKRTVKIVYQSPDNKIADMGEDEFLGLDSMLTTRSPFSKSESMYDSPITRVGPESDNRIRAIQHGKYGYLSASSQSAVQIPFAVEISEEVAIEFQYENAQDFSYGRAAVKPAGGKWGYIDPSGKNVIPFIYDRADFFVMEGKQTMAKVSRGEMTFYINERGDCLNVPNYPCPRKDMKEETVLPIKYVDKQSGLIGFMRNGKWGLLTSEGDTLLKPTYDNQIQFSEGLARVSLNQKWGFIDTKGRVVIPIEYELAQDFSEKLAGVKKNDKWGYIDPTNQTQILFEYDQANPFRHGKAVVEQKGKSSRIDDKGKPAAIRIR